MSKKSKKRSLISILQPFQSFDSFGNKMVPSEKLSAITKDMNIGDFTEFLDKSFKKKS
jgi:hypothetical protein